MNELISLDEYVNTIDKNAISKIINKNLYLKCNSKYKRAINISKFENVCDKLKIKFSCLDESLYSTFGNCFELAYSIAKDSDGRFQYVEGIISDEDTIRLFFQDEIYTFDGLVHAWNYSPYTGEYFDLRNEYNAKIMNDDSLLDWNYYEVFRMNKINKFAEKQMPIIKFYDLKDKSLKKAINENI